MGVFINHLEKKYDGAISACNDISFEIRENGLYFLLGKSGCGKTTLLNVLSGMDSMDSGKVVVDDAEINKMSPQELCEYRNLNIGIIFQELNLIQKLTVERNLQLVQDIRNTKMSKRNNVSTVLEKVGLKGFEKRKVSSLSGGEQQRVAIARCLLKKSHIIVADEPTGSLDQANAQTIFELLRELSNNYIVLVVSHDRESAYKYADRIFHMEDGRIVSEETIDVRNTNRIVFNIEKENHETLNYSVRVEEALEIIKQQLLAKSNFQVLDIRIEANQKSLERQTEFVETENRDSCNLSIIKCLQLAFAFIRGKLLVGIIPIAIAMLLVYVCIILLLYDSKQSIRYYFNDHGIQVMRFYKEESYKNKLEEIVSRQIYSGSALLSLLSEAGIEGEIAYYFRDVAIDLEESDYGANHYANLILLNDGGRKEYVLASGDYPNQGEVLISDIFSHETSLDVGDIISLFNREMRISGVFLCDCDYSAYINKSLRGDDVYAQYNYDTQYNIIVGQEAEIERIKEDCEYILLEYSNFAESTLETSYFLSRLSFSIAKDVVLVNGREPQKTNEILVSSDFAETYSVNCNQEYSFKDIYSERFGLTYTDHLNLARYSQNSVTVVGIFDSLSNKNDVLVTDQFFAELKREYFMWFAGEWIAFGNNIQEDELVSVLEQGVLISEPAVDLMVLFRKTLDYLLPFIVLFLALTVGLVFSVLLMLSNSVIKKNKRDIGIMLALGVRGRTISNVFRMNMAIEITFAAVVFECLVYSVTAIANGLYMDSMRGFDFDLFYVSQLYCLAVITAVFVFGMLVSGFSVRRLSKQKPIDVLKLD